MDKANISFTHMYKLKQVPNTIPLKQLNLNDYYFIPATFHSHSVIYPSQHIKC